MANKSSKDALFALLFSDLMMGAMGVVIVLLVFLQIVQQKGEGVAVEKETIALPPSLQGYKTEAIVRLRLYSCDTPALKAIVVEAKDNRTHYEASINGCYYRLWVFPKGLTEKLELQIKKGPNAINRYHLELYVGGFRNHCQYTINKVEVDKIDQKNLEDNGETLLSISLEKKDVIDFKDITTNSSCTS